MGGGPSRCGIKALCCASRYSCGDHRNMMNSKRIVLLGKSGVGKSSLANMIFKEDDVFNINQSANSGTQTCQAETRSVKGRSITLIDTPGFFDTDRSEEELKPAIVRCITECAPGPHAFLILLKVEKYTEQEEDIIKKITECFSEEAFKYAAVVFTHSDQLPKGMKIQKYIGENEGLKDLVKKCGGRCHVVDNRYWNKDQEKEYKRSRFQVAEILNTVDKMVKENNGGYYTNEMLQIVEEEIQREEKSIRQSSGNMSDQEIRETAKESVFEELLNRFVGVATGVLVGALSGVVMMGGAVAIAFRAFLNLLMTVKDGAGKIAGVAAGGTTGGKTDVAAGGTTGGKTDVTAGGTTGGKTDVTAGGTTGGKTDVAAGGTTGGKTDVAAGGTTGGKTDVAAGGTTGGKTDVAAGGTATGAAAEATAVGKAIETAAGAAALTVAKIAVVVSAGIGAVRGGMLGYSAAEGAASPGEAVEKAVKAVKDEAKFCSDQVEGVVNMLLKTENNLKQSQYK